MNESSPVALSDNRIHALSAGFRGRRDVALKAFIVRLAAARAPQAGPFRIVDLGGRWDYWARIGHDFLDAHDIHVLCVNYSQEEARANTGRHPRLAAETGDARAMKGYADGAFDLVHSNSVIEHVGRFVDMRAFAEETRRLAPAYYVQTPYFWFPVDPHFPRVPLFHWLPLSLRLKLVRRFKVGWSRPVADVDHAMRNVESSVLLDTTQMRALFPDGRLRYERIALLPKSIIVERG